MKMMKEIEDGIGILGSDLLTKVFSRLSPKILCKFKCVSKQWYNLISDPFFVNLHFEQSKTKPNLVLVKKLLSPPLCVSSTFAISTFDITSHIFRDQFSLNLDIGRPITIYCSGLILMYSGGADILHVCNPSTQECVPIDTSYSKIHVPVKSRLLFMPDITGFGFLPTTSEHKIVNFLQLPTHTNVENRPLFEHIALILTLPSGTLSPGSWKNICVDLELQIYRLRSYSSICVSGMLYWLFESYYNRSETSGKILPSKTSGKILTFDLEREEFGLIPCPVRYVIPYDYVYFVELKGALCLVEMLPNYPLLNIWMRKDDENGTIWVKQYMIEYQHMIGFDAIVPDIFQLYSDKVLRRIIPLQINDDGEMLIELKDHSFQYYDLENKTFRMLTEYAADDLYDSRYYWHYDSLFSLRNHVDAPVPVPVPAPAPAPAPVGDYKL